MSGLAGPLIVGQSATIRCMTDIPVPSIEWRDQSSDVLANTTNQRVLNYFISPVTDNLLRHQLTCVAIAGDTVYSETVVILVESKYHYYYMYMVYYISLAIQPPLTPWRW